MKSTSIAGTRTVRVLISAAVLIGAVSVLFFLTVSQDAQYYKHVDEVMVRPDQWYGKSLQLHGFVVDGTILKRPGTLDYRFQIQNGGAVIPASYTGLVPDTFKDGSEVVLKGRLGPEGFDVEPGGVMAKCPSKYEANKTGAPGGVRPD
jgi:cytochrome c-type biogenesis protein CcmE